jgi:hypothetical protein
MNIHPDTAARTGTDMHQQRHVTAEAARLINRAHPSSLEPPTQRRLTMIVASLTRGDLRRRPTAVPTSPATSH